MGSKSPSPPDGCGLSIERGFVFCQELRPRRLFVQLRRLPLPHRLGLSLRLVQCIVLLQEARDAFIRLALRVVVIIGMQGFRFQVSGFRFQVSGFRFQVSGFRFQVLRSGRVV